MRLSASSLDGSSKRNCASRSRTSDNSASIASRSCRLWAIRCQRNLVDRTLVTSDPGQAFRPLSHDLGALSAKRQQSRPSLEPFVKEAIDVGNFSIYQIQPLVLRDDDVGKTRVLRLQLHGTLCEDAFPRLACRATAREQVALGAHHALCLQVVLSATRVELFRQGHVWLAKLLGD